MIAVQGVGSESDMVDSHDLDVNTAYAIAMGTIALGLGLALRIWWLGLLWWAVAHAIGLWTARSDRRFFDVLRRHLALPGHLDG